MQHINKPYIRKTYIEYPDEAITLYLEDTRDNYVNKSALGEIGNICIAKGYIGCNADYTGENETVKEQILEEAIQEIFGITKIDTLSEEYYDIIMKKLQDGTLAALGYTEKSLEYEPQNFGVSIKRNH